jgi:hypothetical protein
MAKLSDRIENVLNEARMLLLGGQVLIGFSYRICFEEGFRHIPQAARLAEVGGLGIMTAGLGWLIWPAAFHQIAEGGSETEAINRFTTTILDWGLLPFVAGLALSFYPVSSALHFPYSAWVGVIVGVFALSFWYGGSIHRRVLKTPQSSDVQRRQEQQEPQTPESRLSERIK